MESMGCASTHSSFSLREVIRRLKPKLPSESIQRALFFARSYLICSHLAFAVWRIQFHFPHSQLLCASSQETNWILFVNSCLTRCWQQNRQTHAQVTLLGKNELSWRIPQSRAALDLETGNESCCWREQFCCFYIFCDELCKSEAAQVVSGGRAGGSHSRKQLCKRGSNFHIGNQIGERRSNASAIRYRRQERKPQVRAGRSAKVNDEKLVQQAHSHNKWPQNNRFKNKRTQILELLWRHLNFSTKYGLRSKLPCLEMISTQ